VREQQPAGAGRAACAPHQDPLEAELADQPGERLAVVEAQVIAARVEALRERAPRERRAHQLEPTQRGRAHQQAPARAQHAANLRQPCAGIGYVLDHLPRPHGVEARVRQVPRARAVHQPQIELGMARPRAAQRLLGDVDPDHVGAGARQLGGEAPLAAADVQHALARLHAIEQEAQAQREVRRLEALGQLAPEIFVVIARGHAARLSCLSNRPQSD